MIEHEEEEDPEDMIDFLKIMYKKLNQNEQG